MPHCLQLINSFSIFGNLYNFPQDIFDDNGTLIGKLRCQMFYEVVDPDSSENSRSEDARWQAIFCFKVLSQLAERQLAKSPTFKSNKCVNSHTHTNYYFATCTSPSILLFLVWFWSISWFQSCHKALRFDRFFILVVDSCRVIRFEQCTAVWWWTWYGV